LGLRVTFGVYGVTLPKTQDLRPKTQDLGDSLVVNSIYTLAEIQKAPGFMLFWRPRL